MDMNKNTNRAKINASKSETKEGFYNFKNSHLKGTSNMNNLLTNSTVHMENPYEPYLMVPKILYHGKFKKQLNNNYRSVFITIFDRIKLSIKNGGKWFDDIKQKYFAKYSLDKLADNADVGRTTVCRAIKRLKQLGLIEPQRIFKGVDRFYLPDVLPSLNENPESKSNPQSNQNGTVKSSDKGLSFQNGTGYRSKMVQQSNNYPSNNKTRSNTVNTKKPSSTSKKKFRKLDSNSYWFDSAKKMGFDENSRSLIYTFSQQYNQRAYSITKWISEARNIIANKYHVSKKIRRFESNSKIQSGLAFKLKKLFTYITTPSRKKAKISNYAGFLINSMKNFFKDCFGIRRDVAIVSPNGYQYHDYSNFRQRKPIRENMPQWFKDQQTGKDKAKSPSKLLNKLNQAHIALMDATDAKKPNHDEITKIKKRINYYQKLYNQERKPVDKPKASHKTKLHKTSNALQRVVQARLRRLGEI